MDGLTIYILNDFSNTLKISWSKLKFWETHRILKSLSWSIILKCIESLRSTQLIYLIIIKCLIKHQRIEIMKFCKNYALLSWIRLMYIRLRVTNCSSGNKYCLILDSQLVSSFQIMNVLFLLNFLVVLRSYWSQFSKSRFSFWC